MEYLDFVLPDWENFNERHFNEVELPVIEEIVARFEEGNRLVVLDAPTGNGKTVIGECSRQRLDTSGLYTCSTLSLQDQFMRDFGDWAAEIRGRANYLPLDVEPGPWETTPSCADCDYDENTRLCSFCKYVEACPYTVAREYAASSELTCTNYAYAFGAWSSKKLRERGLVICDEGDLLESELMRHVSVTISARMRRFLQLRPPKKTVEESWPGWFEYAIPQVKMKMGELRGRDLQTRRRKNTLNRLLDRMRSVADDLEGWVFTGREDSIEFKPVRVDNLGPSTLWDHGQRFLAMSATIISPEEFVQSLGYEGPWASVFAPSVFPKENRPIFVVPITPMTKKTEITAWPQMVKGVRTVLDRHPEERVLVHAHSYALTRYLFNILETLDRPVFAYLNSKERQGAIEDFEATDNAVLLAPSLDRGYDGKDELVRAIIIVKMPMAYLGDKQVSKRLYSTGGQLWYDVQTARSLVQMVGRGVRHDTDHAQTYVLDSKFGEFFGKWKGREGERHRLFPSWFTEALDFNSDARFEIRQAMREASLSVSVQ